MNRRLVPPYLLLSPALLTSVAVLGLCLAVLVVLTFARQSYLDIQLGLTVENIERATTNPLILKLMLRSAVVAGLVTLISVVLAYPIAYFVAFDCLDRRKILWLIIFTLPCWISYLLRILSWKLILGHQGLINVSLMKTGLVSQPLDVLLYNLDAVIIALAHAWAPFAILPIYVSLEKIDRSYLSAAGDLGDGPLRAFLRVTLPMSAPGVTAAAVLIFVPTFGDYVTPQLLGGPSGIMIGNFIAMQFGASNNWPLGAAVALASMLMATALVCLFLIGFTRTLRAIR